MNDTMHAVPSETEQKVAKTVDDAYQIIIKQIVDGLFVYLQMKSDELIKSQASNKRIFASEKAAFHDAGVKIDFIAEIKADLKDSFVVSKPDDNGNKD